MSLITANLGFKVAGTVVLTRPSVASTANMGVVLAFIQGIIDKSYLSWVDLKTLQEKFPSRVSMVGDTVNLAGPVLIVPQFGPLKTTILKVVAFFTLSLFFGAISYLGISLIANRPTPQPLTSEAQLHSRQSLREYFGEERKIDFRKYAIILSTGIISVILARILVDFGTQHFAKAVGVHFLNWNAIKS